MAGSVEHLAVGWELAKRWGRPEWAAQKRGSLKSRNAEQVRKRIDDPAFFLAGNICPDGIQSRKNYQRSMKTHTHFRDGIPDYEFSRPEHLALFHQRLHIFAKEMFARHDGREDLYLGYLVHILTDEHFMRTVWPKFMKRIARMGLNDRMEETFRYFTYDVDQINFRLAKEYPGMQEVYSLLKGIASYEIPGMLYRDELDRSRSWLLEFFFERTSEPEEPVFLSYEETLEFIREAVTFVDEHIVNYLPAV